MTDHDQDLRAVLEGIRDADQHRAGIRCLRLFSAQPATLQALVTDVDRLRAERRPSHPADSGHVTAWTRPCGRVEQFSLLNASGRCDDYSRDHDLSCFGKRFHHAEQHPALAALVAALPHLVNFRINVLGPGAVLPPHEEHSVVRSQDGTVGVRARFHLPLVTNPGATLLLDGDVHHLKVGVVHLVNHGCVHAARNDGTGERVHLVWDMLLTNAATATMFGAGPAPAGFTRSREPAMRPVARRPVEQWERVAPLVGRADVGHVDFLPVQ